MKKEEYNYIIVESYKPKNTSGLHGDIHVKPIAGQEPYTENMHVECSKVLSKEHPVGTKFKIKAKITSKEGGQPFAYSHYSWHFEVL